VTEAEIIPAYQDYLARNLSLRRPLSLGMDAGHGTAGVVALPLFQRLGCEVWPLYGDMDGRFPVHEPDPGVEANLKDLQALVTEQRLDLGVAYDGDGDRLGVIGPDGPLVLRFEARTPEHLEEIRTLVKGHLAAELAAVEEAT
jgi:phosphomannomutase/phosphoglucomutase